MEPRWTVYCHTHVESGRRYVGLTKLTMARRWNQHLANAKRKSGKGCHHFWNAIRRYGKDAFIHHVLGACHNVEQANLVEEVWIFLLDARNPERGFNLAKGGDHIPHPKKNPWDRPEFRERMTAQLKSMHTDPAFVAKNKAASIAVSRSPEFRAKFTDPRLRAMRSEDSKTYWAGQKAAVAPVGSKLCSACDRPGVFAKSSHRKGEFVGVCNACVAFRRSCQKAELRTLVERAKGVPCSVCGHRFPPFEVDLFRTGRQKTINQMTHQLCARDDVLREIAQSRVVCFVCLPSATA
jgi:hypothetical protein